jgi:glycosyltransferase involved in cell wall biosynthesis
MQHKSLKLAVVGDIKPYKKIPEFINLLASFLDSQPSQDNLSLLVLGKSNNNFLHNRLDELQAKHAWITYMPIRPNNELMNTVIVNSDVIAIPYTSLTSGVALQSLSCGKPIISPYSEVLSETIPRELHLLFHNNQELRCMIEKLIYNKKEFGCLPGLEEETIRRLTQHLSWDYLIKWIPGGKIF